MLLFISTNSSYKCRIIPSRGKLWKLQANKCKGNKCKRNKMKKEKKKNYWRDRQRMTSSLSNSYCWVVAVVACSFCPCGSPVPAVQNNLPGSRSIGLLAPQWLWVSRYDPEFLQKLLSVSR